MCEAALDPASDDGDAGHCSRLRHIGRRRWATAANSEAAGMDGPGNDPVHAFFDPHFLETTGRVPQETESYLPQLHSKLDPRSRRADWCRRHTVSAPSPS